MRLALLLILITGCAPTELVGVSSTDLGPLPDSGMVESRDGGHSGLLGGRSVWVFGDTFLTAPAADGSTWRNNSAVWTEQLAIDPATGLVGLTESTDARGAPIELLPRTDAERSYDSAHAGAGCAPPDDDRCGSRMAVWPGPLVADPIRERALLFWWKVRQDPDGTEGVGLGVSVWTDPGVAPERAVLDTSAPNPTVLFPAHGLTPGNAAALQGNWLFAFACPGEAEALCRLARVHVDNVLVPTEWRWYRGLGEWSADPADAAGMFTGAARMSLHRSSALDRGLVVYSAPGSNAVVARTAETPEGPWSEPVEVLGTLAPSGPDLFTHTGLAHGELALHPQPAILAFA